MITQDITWLNHAQQLVDMVARAQDSLWKQFEPVLNKAANEASIKMIKLIDHLPSDASGRVQPLYRKYFMQGLNKIYGQFGRNLCTALGHRAWGGGNSPWRRSLGLVASPVRPQAGSILSAMQNFSKLYLQKLQTLYSEHSFSEAKKWRLPRIKAGGIRQALRPALHLASHQEKSFLENIFRGLDDLRTKHANRIFDTAQGTPYKHELIQIAKDFHSGKLNKRQLKLSIETHLAAMARNETGWMFRKMEGVKQFARVWPSDANRPFELTTEQTPPLGEHPGDRSIRFPITAKQARDYTD